MSDNSESQTQSQAQSQAHSQAQSALTESPSALPLGAAPADVAAPPEPEDPGRSTGWLPWMWVPSLSFLSGIPNAVVSDTSKFLLTDLGLSADKLGVITGLIYLPWTIKPLWSPLVDMVKTKRWWIVGTQISLGLTFLLLALSIRSTNWLYMCTAAFGLLAMISATHDIAADGFYMLGLSESNQAAYTGIRSTAYRFSMIFAKGFMVAAAGYFIKYFGNNVLDGWSTVFLIPAIIFTALGLYHWMVLPKPQMDVGAGSSNWVGDFLETFRQFFRKPNIGNAVAFMLLFRFAEAQVLGMVAPFLKNSREMGGLALSNEQVGLAYGTFGVFGLVVGGISAGALVSYFGLRRLYWVLICIMHIPNIAFLALAVTQPDSLAVISSTLFVEQFGYGFGFTTYILYLMYFSRGQHKTSHYALCTGFMALSVMLPQAVGGYIKEALGFKLFFVYIAVATLPSFVVAYLAWCDKGFIDFYPSKASKQT